MALISKIHSELREYLDFFLRWFPGKSGCLFRSWWYNSRFRHCGNQVSFSDGCIIRGEKNIILGNHIGFGIMNQLYAGTNEGEALIQIGNGCCFNSNVMINADKGGEIRIGNNVLFGPNVVLRASSHKVSDKSIQIKNQGHNPGKIIIEDDVWISANVVLLPNIHIGKGAVVGAGAVVTKDVESYSIVGGVPAKRISQRGS